MWADDLRGIYYIALKDLRAYYLKPPNLSWGVLFPFAFVLAFSLRNPGDIAALVPGLVALTLLFATSSMEAIVIVFERRTGALERLLLAPIRLPALLAAKVLGGMVFGLTVTLIVLAVALAVFGAGAIHWEIMIPALLLSAAAFAALGAFVSVAVREVFEAQTLANFIRFPMMFLGGVFVPVETMPEALQWVARALPLTYSVEAIRHALNGATPTAAAVDLIALAAFAGALFTLSVRLLAGEPESVANETYTMLTIDREGRADWSATPSFPPHRPGSAEDSGTAAWPSAAERERMQALLFGVEIKPPLSLPSRPHSPCHQTGILSTHEEIPMPDKPRTAQAVAQPPAIIRPGVGPADPRE